MASPPTYDEYTATSTRQTTGPSLNLPYVKSIPGIIKIVEIVSDARESHEWNLMNSI